ncbi:hypothetical protein Clacol_005519 [Clathrus columnatus]|uniref:NF-X1-type domain-containing protein n=1 Tax=Clathrus columnatus TaxID=1419009 RepID=A0AAV5AC89_9AGAM|nr:hypothetical protein Clacol_005519 [Clathrus columnatus]
MSNIPPDPPDPPSSNNELIAGNTRDSNNSQSSTRGGRGRGRRRLPVSDREHVENAHLQSDTRSGPSRRGRQGRQGRPGKPGDTRRNSNDVSANTPSGAPKLEPISKGSVETKGENRNSGSTSKPRDRNSSRKGQFGAQLSRNTTQNKLIRPKSPSSDSDLTTRLIYSMKTPPYPDCPICFNPLHPAQPIWSCSLGDGVLSCCWTPFHLKCIKDWAKKSTKDVRDALQARGVTNESEYWRCPGFSSYSCGSSCARKRLTCDHPCPLSCHPGPCPPCTLTIYVPCHCGKMTNAMRCENSRSMKEIDISCGAVCGRRLQCQTHFCAQACHLGDCEKCEKVESVTCYCGQSNKEVECGSGIDSAREAHVLDGERGETHWVGRFDCGSECGRFFDCGLHKCRKQDKYEQRSVFSRDGFSTVDSISVKDHVTEITVVHVHPFAESRVNHDSHPCTLPCHAPSACNESEPCTATITVTCPCGRLQQPTKCGKSLSNPNRSALQLQCRDECAIAKRNAKLAEALGISPDRKEKSNTVYTDELVAFAKANLKFITAVENTLNEFVNSDRKTQILPHTPESRRKFVRELCHLYRTDTQLIDPEPRRRRIDTRIPTPLLTASIAQNTLPSLGRLADLRTVSSTRLPPITSNASSSSSRLGPPNVTGRGWTSVVTVGQGNTPNPPKSAVADPSQHRQKLEVTLPKQLSSLERSSPKSGVRDNWESD